jgi:hypothetical protein
MVPEEFCIDFDVPNRFVCLRYVSVENNSFYTKHKEDMSHCTSNVSDHIHIDATDDICSRYAQVCEGKPYFI